MPLTLKERGKEREKFAKRQLKKNMIVIITIRDNVHAGGSFSKRESLISSIHFSITRVTLYRQLFSKKEGELSGAETYVQTIIDCIHL